ncbi:uncharacterized protein [Magallana gigas]|uniref:uncharacterized protein n=1 Tax=Magallana gigas TaxID=29159 RepID=UPI00148A89FE|nr:uncharacterized protein LOC117683028 [Crassostrea gigas]
MIVRFDFILLLCIYGFMPCVGNKGVGSSPKKPTNCTETTTTTHNPSTSVCSCPTDCSKGTITTTPTTEAKSTTMHSTTITTTAHTSTAAITTAPTLSSAYPDPFEQKSDLCLDIQGTVIGAAIGGAIFGSILTACIVFVYFRRKSKNSYDSKTDQSLKTVRNAAYGYSNDNEQVNAVTVPVNSAYSEINDGMRKSAVISPIMRQADPSQIDEVYNHLGESDKEDRSDYYDHAGPVPSLSVMEDGYGILSMESEGNDNYNTMARGYSADCGKSMTAENKQSNDYFILETQNN